MFKSFIAIVLALAATLSFAAVDANKASQADLEAIKGIGPAVSQRMLDERAKKPFADWADMETRVKGVGPGNAAKFSAAGLTVNGATYAPASKAAKTEKPAKPAKTDSKPKAVKS